MSAPVDFAAISEALARNAHVDLEQPFEDDEGSRYGVPSDAYVLAEEVRRLRGLVVELGVRFDVDPYTIEIVRVEMFHYADCIPGRYWKERMKSFAHRLWWPMLETATQHIADIAEVSVALAEVSTLTPAHNERCWKWARMLRGLV